MIHYQLRCTDDHGFDGWFASSDSFDSQARRGLLECPVCGTSDVQRALMAPAIGRKGGSADPGPSQPRQVAVAPDRLPDQMRAMLQKLRSEVEKNCDHVGADFADQARRMHDGELPARPIYGDATAEQAEALADDGIAVARIPWVPRTDG